MTGGAVARRYALSLFDLAAAENRTDGIGEELDRVNAAFAQVPELPRALADPAHSRAVRGALAARVGEEQLGLGPLLRNFLRVLIENGRVLELPEIALRYRQMADEAAGRVQVMVTSAAPLGDEERRRLEEGLSRVTGKKVTLEVRIDPELIGGLQARVGHLVFDGSVRAQLDAMRDELRRAT